MAQQDQLPTAVGTNHVTLNAVEGALNAIDATSKHFQTVANETSTDQATQALDKLRSTRVVDGYVDPIGLCEAGFWARPRASSGPSCLGPLSP
jgi:hypothetical protein